jgi:hypothetical protein
VKTDSTVKTQKLADYAANGEKTQQKADFAAAVNELASSRLGTASSRKVIDVITKLFEADEALNQPHTLLVHQRSKLLFELLGAYAKEQENSNCWTTVKKMAALKPYAPEIPNLIEVVAKSLRTQGPSNLVVLISCHPRVSIALATRKRLQTILGSNFRILIVVGQREAPLHPPIMDGDFLVVDANDNYESLPEKITKTFEYIYRTFADNTKCFKVDEDLPISNGEQLQELMLALSQSKFDYAGFAGNNKENFERTWHYGKCENTELSRRPYGKRYPGAFAYGPFYFLSSNAVRAFTSETIRFPDEILGHLYEDKFVGDTLREAGITISALEPNEWITAVGKQWWTINRLWNETENKLLNAEINLAATLTSEKFQEVLS